jgi:hypothetical protein
MEASMHHIIPIERIQSRILFLRGHRVILDADLASLYGAPTKYLNQQVNRNQERFPSHFAFRLTATEKREVVANCNHLQTLKFSHALPIAFTEHGALMAANLLNTTAAVRTSVFIIEAFVRLRESSAQHRDLARKVDQLESVVGLHDERIRSLFEAIRGLMNPPVGKRRRIGFKSGI